MFIRFVLGSRIAGSLQLPASDVSSTPGQITSVGGLRW